MIRIRIADESDAPRLVRFIGDHWSPEHVFVHRPEVFRWQHIQDDGRLNMVLAEDTALPGHESVLGVLGFIPMGRFAPALGDRDVMLAIWKVREVGVPPGVGLRLLKFVQSELQPRFIAAIGTSKMVRPIYEVLRYRVGSLQQAAVFNPDRRGELRIADFVPDEAFDPIADPGHRMDLLPVGEHLRDVVDRVAGDGIPAKSWAYVEKRYLSHPWYDYEVRAVTIDDIVVAVVIWRAIAAEGTRVLRVVDVVGATEWLRQAGSVLRAEVVAAGAEYLDIMHLGIDDGTLEEGGFVTRARHPEMVLPNYFAPFERRNIEIELAYKVLDGDATSVRLFRADSDQDRPNLVGEVDGVD